MELQPVGKMLGQSDEINDLSSFKSLLVTGLWYIILTSPLPSIQSCSSKCWAWSCIASIFYKGWRGDQKHKSGQAIQAKIRDSTQVLLQLVVAVRQGFFFQWLVFTRNDWYGIYYHVDKRFRKRDFVFSRFHGWSKQWLPFLDFIIVMILKSKQNTPLDTNISKNGIYTYLYKVK